MALRRWDLEAEEARPDLALVPPAPPRHRAVAASIFALLLIGALGSPLISAARRSAIPRERPRPLPASALEGLDRLPPLRDGNRPRSSEPVGGVAFVRCSHLWTALPDGSKAHRILDAPGISSPAFSPDARTIAFFAAGAAGPELWMAAADGSAARRIGAFESGGWPVAAQPMGLAWSEKGDELLFALTDPRYDPLVDGSSLWDLHLDGGRIEPVRSGWPQPFWFGTHAVSSVWSAREGDTVFEAGGRDRGLFRLSNPGVVTAAVVPDEWWSLRPSYGVVVMQHDDIDRRYLVLKKSSYSHGPGLRVPSPAGHSIPLLARPAISQDGSKVFVSLVDDSGAPDLGVLDTASMRWTILPYAWQPSSSPAPTSTGPVAARRSERAADELLSAWGRGSYRAGLLLGKRFRKARVPLHRLRYATEQAEKRGSGWVVPALVYGWDDDGFGTQEMTIRVRGKRGRVVARPEVIRPVRHIETLEEAVAFLQETLTVPVMAPELPPGATISTRRWMPPVEVWSTSDKEISGALNLQVPGSYQGIRIMYGDASFWSCGDVKGDPTTVQGVPALTGNVGDTVHQVLWPATRQTYPERPADYSVWAELPLSDVLSVAESMSRNG